MAVTPNEQVEAAISSDDVVVFMKGTREAPSCGFSAQIVEVLNHLLPNYSTFDVRNDPLLRQAVKSRSGWPTFPQLYIRGEFVGGSDIAKELFVTGELAARLGLARTELPDPELRVSRPALDALERLAAGEPIRLELDAQGDANLSVSTKQPSDIEIPVERVRFVLDVLTASRVDGLRIDYVSEPGGFVLTRPTTVGLSAPQVAEMLASEQNAPLLVDCRTLAEFRQATLPKAEHLTRDLLHSLSTGAEGRRVVFFCRNGNRAQNVAEHFSIMWAKPALYLKGGLEGWIAPISERP